MEEPQNVVALLLVIAAIFAKAWTSREVSLLRGKLIEESSRRRAAEERQEDLENRIRELLAIPQERNDDEARESGEDE